MNAPTGSAGSSCGFALASFREPRIARTLSSTCVVSIGSIAGAGKKRRRRKTPLKRLQEQKNRVPGLSELLTCRGRRPTQHAPTFVLSVKSSSSACKKAARSSLAGAVRRLRALTVSQASHFSL